MSSKTTNYNLHKIDLTDAPPDITVLNGNFDTIDTQLKNNANHASNTSNPHGVTAAQAGALPASGGTMSGTIEFKQVSNGYGRLAKNHGSTADYGMYLTDTDSSGNIFKLIVSAKDNAASVVPNDNSGPYKLFGEHNKALVRTAVFDHSMSDITAGVTGLTNGRLYLVYD